MYNYSLQDIAVVLCTFVLFILGCFGVLLLAEVLTGVLLEVEGAWKLTVVV